MRLKYSSTCRMWVWILIVTLIIGMILFVFYPWQKIDTTVTGPFQLQESKQVGDIKASQRILALSNEGSLQAFVYPLAFQRTGVVTLCSDSTAPPSGEPNCDSGRFGICTCAGTDCSRCKHVGYVNILNISNVVRLEMLTAPDASRQNAALVQLVVRTFMRNPLNNNVEVVEETMVLPKIPLQKWTMITIARDARRYDIYYNDKLVSSKRTEKLLDVTSAISPIIAGDPLLQGSVAYIEVFDKRLSQAEVATNYHRLADTTGQPYLEKENEMMANLFKRCEGGNCLKGPAVRPSSPLLDWDTSYA
jgi:hypothetical protein